jgi:RimJ/RimL family protein N-acetyltransferase
VTRVSAPARARAEGLALRLRAVHEGDARLLFAWVNRPDSLAAKLETDAAIPWETHQSWLAARLADPGSALWIAEQDGRPVGQVRVERREIGLEVDIFVTAEARGRGLARCMLARAARACADRWPGLPLVARVKTGNLASERLFLAAGYALARQRDDHRVYVRPAAD